MDAQASLRPRSGLASTAGSSRGDDHQPILVTGATGYIGGRLVPQLLAKGYRVRCLARDPERLRGRDWTGEVEVVAGDVLDRGSLGPALAGCGAAYYLVHSMAGGEGSFCERDLRAAQELRGGRGRGRARPGDLPRRPGPEVGAALDPPDQPPRGRRRAPRRPGARHRAARRHDHRLG